MLLVTRRLPADVEARLARDYEAIQVDLPGGAKALANAVSAEAMLCTPAERISAEVIAKLPESVRIIATFSVGTDHIDLAAAEARGLIVTNTPDVLTEATADVAMLCMLGAARLAWSAQENLRQGKWTGWEPTQFLGKELSGARLGILGMGRIGKAVARRAAGFGLKIHYWNRSPVDRAGLPDCQPHESPDSLFAVADVLSLHVASTPETAGIVNARTIGLLPRDALVVNTARGALVNDEDLIAALRDGRLWAAGLDVFAGEPKLHPGYLGLANVYILPHVGSATVATRNAMGFRALDNLDAFFAGRAVPDPVRPKRSA